MARKAKKSSKSKQSRKPPKIVAMFSAAIILVATGVYATARITGNEEFSIWSVFSEKTLTEDDTNDGSNLEEDGEGWWVDLSLDGNNEKTFSGGTKGKWDMTMEIYTCDKDSQNAKWSGEWDWDWSIKESDSNTYVKTDKAVDQISLTTEDGYGAFQLGNSVADLTIKGRDVRVNFYMENLGEKIELKGKLMKGYSKCNEEMVE